MYYSRFSTGLPHLPSGPLNLTAIISRCNPPFHPSPWSVQVSESPNSDQGLSQPPSPHNAASDDSTPQGRRQCQHARSRQNLERLGCMLALQSDGQLLS
ncbi:hypothetical protein DsansV1_C09g0091121 [Dioscorea sansibarensis]